jgi:hypothetical protein
MFGKKTSLKKAGMFVQKTGLRKLVCLARKRFDISNAGIFPTAEVFGTNPSTDFKNIPVWFHSPVWDG